MFYRAAYEFLVEDDDGEKFPPIWTPTNSISKAAALEILFPRKVEDVGYKPEQLPPPQVGNLMRDRYFRLIFVST